MKSQNFEIVLMIAVFGEFLSEVRSYSTLFLKAWDFNLSNKQKKVLIN